MDDKIYTLLAGRNQEGLKLLLDKYGGLISYVVKNTGCINECDLSECVSDVLFTIWKRIEKYDQAKSSLKAWIVIVARGCAVDYVRKLRKRRLEVPMDDVMESLVAEDAFSGLETGNIISALQKLTPPDNELFYRRYVLGEDVAAIAKATGLTQENIYKRISRGREKLKGLIVGEGFCNV